MATRLEPRRPRDDDSDALWLWIDDVRGSSALNWIVTGLIQIVWGFRRLALYPTARRSADDPPAIAQLESIVRELSQRSAKADPTVAEFRTGRIRRHRNRLGLFADGAVALLEHQAVRLERRADIWIEARGTTSLGRWIKVRVRMGDLQLTGEMPAEHFERFDRWKSGLTRAGAIAAWRTRTGRTSGRSGAPVEERFALS